MLKEVKKEIYHLLHPKLTFFLTSSDGERDNVMACAWATPASDEPAIVIVCVSKESLTAGLIKRGGEFVINIPSRDLIDKLWICGRYSGREINKFEKAGLKKINSKKVRPPSIEGSIGIMECKLANTVDAGECYAFFGEVVYACADQKFFKRGSWTEQAAVPMHLSGKTMVFFTAKTPLF